MAGESRLELYLKHRCDVEGIFVRKVSAVGNTGFPDRLLGYAGRVYLVELKNPNGTGVLARKQKSTHAELAAVGISVDVIETYDGVDDVIAQILDH